jgi:hypothetical protein
MAIGSSPPGGARVGVGREGAAGAHVPAAGHALHAAALQHLLRTADEGVCAGGVGPSRAAQLLPGRHSLHPVPLSGYLPRHASHLPLPALTPHPNSLILLDDLFKRVMADLRPLVIKFPFPALFPFPLALPGTHGCPVVGNWLVQGQGRFWLGLVEGGRLGRFRGWRLSLGGSGGGW